MLFLQRKIAAEVFRLVSLQLLLWWEREKERKKEGLERRFMRWSKVQLKFQEVVVDFEQMNVESRKERERERERERKFDKNYLIWFYLYHQNCCTYLQRVLWGLEWSFKAKIILLHDWINQIKKEIDKNCLIWFYLYHQNLDILNVPTCSESFDELN